MKKIDIFRAVVMERCFRKLAQIDKYRAMFILDILSEGCFVSI